MGDTGSKASLNKRVLQPSLGAKDFPEPNRHIKEYIKHNELTVNCQGSKLKIMEKYPELKLSHVCRYTVDVSGKQKIRQSDNTQTNDTKIIPHLLKRLGWKQLTLCLYFPCWLSRIQQSGYSFSLSHNVSELNACISLPRWVEQLHVPIRVLVRRLGTLPPSSSRSYLANLKPAALPGYTHMSSERKPASAPRGCWWGRFRHHCCYCISGTLLSCTSQWLTTG